MPVALLISWIARTSLGNIMGVGPFSSTRSSFPVGIDTNSLIEETTADKFRRLYCGDPTIERSIFRWMYPCSIVPSATNWRETNIFEFMY
jgi:hypothetical protein